MTSPLAPVEQVGVRLAVFRPDGRTLIAYVPRRRGVEWLEEVNAPGTGKFEMHLSDPLLVQHPDLLDQFNIVKIGLRGKWVKAFVIEEINPARVADESEMWVSVAGRGPMSVLEYGIVYPEYGLRELVSEDRHFNFASKDGPWRDTTAWVQASGHRWADDPYAGRKTFPKNWPDPDANWLWSSGQGNHQVGKNWFRTKFTLTATTPVVIYATADNDFVGYLDGEVILNSGTGQAAFRNRFEWRTTLAKGEHVMGAAVTNTSANNVANPGGWIFSIYRANQSGEPTGDVIVRSLPSNTIVKPYGAAPGWNGATILQEVIREAQARSVTAIQPITFSFTNKTDSNGVAWPAVKDVSVPPDPNDPNYVPPEVINPNDALKDDVQERVVKIGTTDIYDLAQQIIELGMDIHIDHDFVMHAWKKRGTNRAATVRLLPNRDLTAGAGTIRSSKVRNQALVKYNNGWLELYSASSKNDYGRRETGISLGTSDSLKQTAYAGAALVVEVARPEKTIPVSYTSIRGAQPYRDFDLGDTVTVPDVYSGLRAGRLMSVAARERDDGEVEWDLDFYPDEPDDLINSIVIPVGSVADDEDSLYQAQVLSDSPWAYWRFKETAGSSLADRSGNLRTLTLTGEPLLNQPGPVDRSVLFSHLTTQYGATSAGSLFTFSYSTVECWVHISQFQTAAQGRETLVGFAVDYDNVTHDKALGLNPDGSLFWYVFDGQPRYLNSTARLATNTWYHIVGSIGVEGQKLYINGVLHTVNKAVNTSYRQRGQRVFVRGGGNGLNAQRARVSIAEPAVYYQQLLDSRIKSHYDAGSGVDQPRPNPEPQPSPSPTPTSPEPSPVPPPAPATKTELYESTVKADSPWLFYRYRQTDGVNGIRDSSGNLRHGQPHGGFLYDQAGPVDRAVLFSNLAVQYIISPSGSRFDHSQATIETWVYLTDLPTSGRAPLVGMGVEFDHVTHDKTIGVNPDGSVWFYVSFNGAKYVTTSEKLQTGRWYHIVARVGSFGQWIWINGVSRAYSGAATGSYNGLGQRVLVHAGGNGFEARARCFIAETAVYAYQLAEARVVKHYQDGVS